MSANERRQLERVRKQLEKEKAKLQEQKAQFRTQQRQLESERRTLATQKKQLKNAQAKLNIQARKNTGRRSPGASPRAGSGREARERLESEEWKGKYQKSQKKFRALHSKYQDMQAQLKLLQRQLKKAKKGKGGRGNDKKIRDLERQIRVLKKQLRLLKKDWEKRKRYYSTQSSRFKNEQDKWIRQQRQQAPQHIIKYVFLDDIRAIKIFRRGKATIRAVTKDGGEFEYEDPVEIEYADADAEAARAIAEELAQESFMQFTEEELGDPNIDPDEEPVEENKEEDDEDMDEEPATEDADDAEDLEPDGDELLSLPLEDGDEDLEPDLLSPSLDLDEDILDDDPFDTLQVEIDDDDEEKEPPSPAIDMTQYVEKEVYEMAVRDIKEFVDELRQRTSDLHTINQTLETTSDGDEIDTAMKSLLDKVQVRHSDLFTTLRNLGNLEIAELDEAGLESLNKNWQDEIYRLNQTAQTKQDTTAPLGVTETVSCILEELDARTNDLVQLQDLKEKKDMTPEEKDQEIKDILDAAEDRHANSKAKLDEIDPDVSDFLDRTNNTWEIGLQQLGVSLTEDPEPEPEAEAAQPEEVKEEPERKPSVPTGAMSGMHGRTPTLRELLIQKTDDKTSLQELNARTDDLQQILEAYGADHGPELLRDLRSQVEDRHRAQIEDDNIPEDMQLDNKDWEDLIAKVSEKNELEKGKKEEDQALINSMKPEMDSRNDDLRKILSILNGDEPPAALEDLALNVEERHRAYPPVVERESPAQDVYRKLLFDLAQQKQVSPPPADLEEKRDQMGDFNQFVTDQCAKELKSRISDVATVKQLDPTDAETLQEMLDSVHERHERQKATLRQANKNMPSDSEEVNSQREALFERLAADNDRWLEELGHIQDQAKDSRKLRQRYAQCLDELNQRTADLERVARLLELKEEEAKAAEEQGDGDDNEEKQPAADAAVEPPAQEQPATEVVESATELKDDDLNDDDSDGGNLTWEDRVKNMLEEIEERHVEETEKIDATLTTSENKDSADEFNTNNDDWRTAVKNILGYEQEEEKEEVMDDTPWLKKDPLRNEYIDRIMVDPDQLGSMFTLRDIGVYLNRVFAEDEDAMLYIPIDTSGDDLEAINREVLSKTFDGVLLNRLINVVQPDFSDLRAVHTADPIDPFPISDQLVVQNIQMLLGTCKALGVKMGTKHKTPHWLEPDKQAKMLRDIVDGLARRHIDFLVNLDNCPQLVRLTKEIEDVDVVKHLDGVDWIPRWLNHFNGRPVMHPIEDFNRDLSRTIGASNPDFDGEAAASSDDATNAQALQDVSLSTNPQIKILAPDLIDNNTKCQNLMAAQMFAFDSGMEPLSAAELRAQEEALSKDTSTDENYLNWLNSLGLVDEEIDNLYRDLTDGVVLLKLLDRLRPGVVQWKGVRLKIRHKFDKMTNCKKAIGYCRDPFNFRIIGFDSDDLVAGNQKFIHSLLWQIMRYHATKALADLNNGQQVRDEDIIQFANLQVSSLESPYSRPIKGLKDKSLTNGLFYLDVIRAVAPDAVREDLIYAEVPQVPKPDDGTKMERLANIRYAASLVRRLGGDLFATPEDLFRMDTRAVLSLLAAIMTISVQGSQETTEDDDLMGQVLSGSING